MGKIKNLKAKRHQSLTQQILATDAPRPTKRTKTKKRFQEDDGIVGEKLTKNILKEVHLQQNELEEEYGIGSEHVKKVTVVPHVNEDSDSDHTDEEELCNDELCDVIVEVNEEDERAMASFMNTEKSQRRTIADEIFEKKKHKETEISTLYSDHPSSAIASQLDEKVVSVFRAVGEILTKYRAGKLPQAFKVIPSLENWEEVLYLTEPDKWSAAGMYQATRMFSSNLSSAKAQRFYNLVLLPRIRDDIAEYKRLNFHLYMALKKSLFKPAAFFKGILLPLCEAGTCTLREALIIGSVIAKTSIPLLHSCAALLKIAEMEYSGANSIFIRILLDKKYALPFRVIDAVVFHFLKFQQDPRVLPVLWHQSLLTFVQRYKEDISVEQKEVLLELIRVKAHHEISPEIRREIVNSKCRDLGTLYLHKNENN